MSTEADSTERWLVIATKIEDGVTTKTTFQRIFDEPIRIIPRREYERLVKDAEKTEGDDRE